MGYLLNKMKSSYCTIIIDNANMVRAKRELPVQNKYTMQVLNFVMENFNKEGKFLTWYNKRRYLKCKILK